jgi:hypothetical protein
MSKAKPKRSGRQSRLAREVNKPTGSAKKLGKGRTTALLEISSSKASGGAGTPRTSRTTRAQAAREASKPAGSANKHGKGRTAAVLEINSGKASKASGTPPTSRATKAKQAASQLKAKARASVSGEGKPRAAAQSTPRQARRQFELPTPPAPPHEKIAIEAKAEPVPFQDLQSKPPLASTPEATGPNANETGRTEPPELAVRSPTPFLSPFASVVRANAEIHQLMTSRTIATVRFATSLAGCRSPMDLWVAQIRFFSDFLSPRPSGGPSK